MNSTHMLLIGGRSGVGKSTVAFALHDLLSARGVKHVVIEGDALDLAYPAPWEQQMAERNPTSHSNRTAVSAISFTFGVQLLRLAHVLQAKDSASQESCCEPTHIRAMLLRGETSGQRVALQ